jgi:hypothetical protein
MAAKNVLAGMQESLARILKSNGLDPRCAGLILFIPLEEDQVSVRADFPNLDPPVRIGPSEPSKVKARGRK